MYTTEKLQALGIDIGSSNPKTAEVEIEGSSLFVSKGSWATYHQATLPLREEPVRAWYGGILQHNLRHLQLQHPVGEYEAIGITGLGGTSLSVVERATGQPVVVFYDKPSLTHTHTPATQVKMVEASVPEQADVRYSWTKALAVAEEWMTIRELINRPDLEFSEIGIEPLLTTYARLLLDLPFDSGIGFTPDEWKGITGDPNGVTKPQVEKALQAYGYSDEQFIISDRRSFEEYNLYMASDFATVASYVRNEQDIGTISEEAILVETDSNFKIYTRAEGVSPSLKRYNASGFAYRLITNGASTNDRLVKQYILPAEKNGMNWYVMADQAAGDAIETLTEFDQTRYLYFPDGEKLGVLWDLEQQSEIPFAEYVNLSQLDLGERQAIAAAIYTGVGAELRYQLEKVQKEKPERTSVLLHGGFLSYDEQVAKRIIVGSLLRGAGFDASLVTLPDPSEMIAVKAAHEFIDESIRSSKKLETIDLDTFGTLDLEAYYARWRDVRGQVTGL